MIEDDYDGEFRRARLAYRRRRDRLTSVLSGLGLEVSGISAGLHAVVEFSGTGRECELLARAAGRGLALHGLESYRAPAAARDRAAW